MDEMQRYLEILHDRPLYLFIFLQQVCTVTQYTDKYFRV